MMRLCSSARSSNETQKAQCNAPIGPTQKMNKREQYDAIEALNQSKAKLLLRSPRHFRVPVEETPDTTPALLLGTIVHAQLLEGINPDKCFTIKPAGMSFATREGKAWRAAQDKPIITRDEAGDVIGMCNAILDNIHARNILSTCILREQIYTGMIQGLACKALVDAVGSAGDQPAVVEIKTSLDCRAEFFGRRAVSDPFHYDLQSAWYRTLTKAQVSCWIVVENHSPWDVAVYFPSSDMRTSGELKMHKALNIYKMCKQLDRWPGSQPDPAILHLPRWYNVDSMLAVSFNERQLLGDHGEDAAEMQSPAQISLADT